ncbi:type ISP restriction/modification enzyme [Flavobacterium sp.]|uniref:type ISP restriction/modification enzyme n=1 Tax=Flavobacterium sp. TaxID=239 RepID=UPI00333FA790
MTLHQYIETINQRFRLGNATEHTFRGDLQQLLESLVTDIRATNEPKRQSCGAPDYIITRGEIPVGFIEAKDVGDKDLEGKKKTGNQEQFDRYKTGLANLIITDYIDFHFYRDGIFTTKISIGKVENGSIVPQPENYDQFTQLFKNFCETISQSIKSPTRLAEMMAGKARLMADIIEKSLNEDDENSNLSNLKRQMLSFQKMLISDIDNKSFSDLYSQTIAYGMFAARYHDPTLQNFSREEAVKLIPKSNPFLRKLFKDIADEDLDTRLVWIIDELVNVFLASDVASIMKNFGKSTKQEDPVVHFYETFLGAYNPALRKARGVWYTPQPVVNFIVRAVDDILKTEFDLPEGLADSSKKKIKVNYQGKQIEKEVHKVQILDPATGTGTFLAETIKHIHKKYDGMQGIWSKYVEDDLIPRINGFELLMASYAMAHLKLDMLLTETGYVPTKDQRLRVFLTNSLEEPHPDSGTLWGNLLSDEADQANEVKRDTPVMCIIGNPPYSGESANKGEWIMKLMDDYKKEPGGVQKLQEQNSKFINDDYVKFLRYGQHYIEKNGQGVLAFINPHGFLDNPTFRGMRWNLLKTYDKIYTIDLHGNSKKKETAPDGSADVNVFDIMQGVSINLFVKTGKKKPSELGKVFNFDLFGKREIKYNFLIENNFNQINFNDLEYSNPHYFFIKKDLEIQKIYNKGISVNELFSKNTLGIQTHRDSFVISIDKNILKNRITDFYNPEISNIDLISKYKIKETNEWLLDKKRKGSFIEQSIVKIDYRFFDTRFVYYSNDVIDRDRKNIMRHLIHSNVALTISKQQSSSAFRHIFLSKNIQESCLISLQTKEGGYTFPLYLYPENNEQQTIDQSSERTPNLNDEIVKEISGKIRLTFTNEKETIKDTFAPIDILDYIYGVLHSPTYREKYKEFLKIDFPRVPYPKDKDTFWKLVKLGGEIRQIHLLESAVVEKPISKYPHTGTNIVGKTKYENGNVYINETQCFEDVPEVAWNFYIGGYQPAQKWLKDRKDRELQIDDIRHYMKIIVALTETDRLMKEIDKIEIE